MNRTASSGSRVPPAVTSTRSPSSGRGAPVRGDQLDRRAGARPARRGGPTPHSPFEASAPVPGSITCTPRSRRSSMFAWVAGCAYMWLFIAGATSTGLRAGQIGARQQVVGVAVGELRDRVGGRRRDAEAVAAPDQLEMADRVVLGRLLAGVGAAQRVALELVDQHRRAGDRPRTMPVRRTRGSPASGSRAPRGRPWSRAGRARPPCRRRYLR